MYVQRYIRYILNTKYVHCKLWTASDRWVWAIDRELRYSPFSMSHCSLPVVYVWYTCIICVYIDTVCVYVYYTVYSIHKPTSDCTKQSPPYKCVQPHIWVYSEVSFYPIQTTSDTHRNTVCYIVTHKQLSRDFCDAPWTASCGTRLSPSCQCCIETSRYLSLHIYTEH